MKKILICILFINFACTNKPQDKTEVISNQTQQPVLKTEPETNSVIDTESVENDPTLLLSNFNEFRSATVEGNKQKVKSYIEFPVTDSSMEGRVYVKFTEDDYDAKFDEIFPEKFIKALSEIDFETLLKEKKVKTVNLNDGKEFTYLCSASIMEDEFEVYIPTYQNSFNEDGSVLKETLFSNMAYKFRIKNNSIVLVNIENNG